MKSTPTLLLAAVAALSLTLPAAGQAPATPDQPRPAATPRTRSESPDMEFVKKATEAGLREIEVGKLASEKASSVEVRAFAKHMVDTHTLGNAELKALVSLPPSATAQKPSAENTLGGLTGEAFDRAYMTKMVQDHQAAIDLFEAEVRNGRDAPVKNWAAMKLPAVRGHWQNARVLQAKVGATTTTTTTDR